MPEQAEMAIYRTKIVNVPSMFVRSHSVPMTCLLQADAAQFGLALGAYHCTAIARLGVCDDGGWTVCLDQLTPKLRSHRFANAAAKVAIKAGASSKSPAPSCLVYSIGVGKIEWQTTFDFAASAIGCEVYMFDPSIGLPRQDPTGLLFDN
jgi:hypothetical protein